MGRSRFYTSKKWRNLRDTYAKSQDYICERCFRPCFKKNDPEYIRLKAEGKDVVFGIVHHIEHINDSNYQDQTLSMNWDNLELLCITCHNQEHMTTTSEVREDVRFDSQGRIIHG